jgi:hypothetical protein
LTHAEVPKRKVGSGGPKKTSEMTDKLTKCEATINPKITAVQLENKLSDVASAGVCPYCAATVELV